MLNLKPSYLRTLWCFPSQMSHGKTIGNCTGSWACMCTRIFENTLATPIFTWPRKLQKHLQGRVKEAQGRSWKNGNDCPRLFFTLYCTMAKRTYKRIVFENNFYTFLSLVTSDLLLVRLCSWALAVFFLWSMILSGFCPATLKPS